MWFVPTRKNANAVIIDEMVGKKSAAQPTWLFDRFMDSISL